MRKIIFAILAMATTSLLAQFSIAAEGESIPTAVRKYIEDKSRATGTFDVYDPEIGKTRMLSLIRLNSNIGKSGERYYSSADFKDMETAETVELDFDVDAKNGKTSVIQARIRKVGGKERYTYDENNNMIPVLR